VKQTSAERREEARRKLERAVEALAQSDGWRAWIRTRSTFRRYSLHNTILIAMQRPEATRVAGYRTWQRLGRQVLRGEKGISILAPVTHKERRPRYRGWRGPPVLPRRARLRHLPDGRRPPPRADYFADVLTFMNDLAQESRRLSGSQ
jgi:hypothetical protein